jgi:thiol-disulfide isomerase/thioredoxin
MVTEITMQDMQRPLPVGDNKIRVLMFFGTNCGPCKATMPHYETVASSFIDGRVQIEFLRINAWEPQEQATFCKETYGINGVPNFKVYFRGEQIKERVGGGDEVSMKQFVNEAIYEALARIQERI